MLLGKVSLFFVFFCRRRWSDKVFCACEGCDSISGVGSSLLMWLVEFNRQGKGGVTSDRVVV